MTQVLANGEEGARDVWLDECRASFSTMIEDKQSREAAEAKTKVMLKGLFKLKSASGALWKRLCLHQTKFNPRDPLAQVVIFFPPHVPSFLCLVPPGIDFVPDQGRSSRPRRVQ